VVVPSASVSLRCPMGSGRGQRTSSRLWPALLASLTLIAAYMNLLGCRGADEYHFAVPSGLISPDVAPTEDGRVYFLRNAFGELGSPAELWRTEVNKKAESMGAVDASALPCRSPFLYHLRKLPDGRLGATASCPGTPSSATYVTLTTAPGGVAAAPLAPLPDDDDVVWSDDGQSGWVTRNSAGCAGIAAMSRVGVQPFGSYTPSSLLPWNIDGDFFGPAKDDCTGRGRAAFPALTSDGEALLFLASPASAGVSPGGMGTGRDQKTWNLYRLALKSRSLATLATGLSQPTGMTAGDDGLILVCGMKDGRRGVWRIDTGSRKLELVKAGNFGPPILSPGHRSIIIVRYSSDDDPETGDTALVRFPIREN